MSEQTLDQWQILLKEQRIVLEACQKEQHVHSCMLCEKFLDCSLRDGYIKAVYDSMSKGKGGGFEF